MDRRTDMMRHFPAMLERWRGADARLWTLTSGHPTLTILLTRPNKKQCLLIHYASPASIEAPRHWSPSDIHVELAEEMFRVRDTQSAVSIEECGVSLSEQPIPPWETGV